MAEENNDESEVLRQEVPGEPVCYFNNQNFPNGAHVKSGGSILRCVYGIWIQAGPADSGNPKKSNDLNSMRLLSGLKKSGRYYPLHRFLSHLYDF
ncbi:MAG: YnjH family protein [Gammaproteobacteria bacterium]|nr:YnjH family protein [Gammaproteobacteria bacterium]